MEILSVCIISSLSQIFERILEEEENRRAVTNEGELIYLCSVLGKNSNLH